MIEPPMMFTVGPLVIPGGKWRAPASSACLVLNMHFRAPDGEHKGPGSVRAVAGCSDDDGQPRSSAALCRDSAPESTFTLAMMSLRSLHTLNLVLF